MRLTGVHPDLIRPDHTKVDALCNRRLIRSPVVATVMSVFSLDAGRALCLAGP